MWNAFIGFLHTTVYTPLYNGLVFFIDIIPGHDVGIAVIVLTILVRIILIPLSKKAVESQLAMKKVGPEVEVLKKKHKNDKAEQSKAIMALYKERGVHPFAGFGLLLIQLPILFALYYIFAQSGLPKIEVGILYPFVNAPEAVNMAFLGFVDMAAAHNVVFAVLVAGSQWIYTRLSMGRKQDDPPIEASLSKDLAKSFESDASM